MSFFHDHQPWLWGIGASLTAIVGMIKLAFCVGSYKQKTAEEIAHLKLESLAQKAELGAMLSDIDKIKTSTAETRTDVRWIKDAMNGKAK